MRDQTTELSRRGFLKTSAVAGAGLSIAALLAGCAPKSGEDGSKAASGTPAEDIAWDKSVDVLVVGYGGAGSAAAIEAKRAGAEVLMVEAFTEGGGSTAMNGGAIMMGGTALQKKLGVEDSVENFYKYMAAAAGDNANLDLLKTACDESADLYDWCVGCGMEFETGTVDLDHHRGGFNPGISLGFTGNELARPYRNVTPSVPHGHFPQPNASGQDIFTALRSTVEAEGVEVLLGTPAVRLVTNSSGRVIGAFVGEKGDQAIEAKKGVILTCGGFTDNAELLKDTYPHPNKRGSRLTSSGREDGSGILMGIEIGAATYGMGSFQIGDIVVNLAEPLAQGILINEYGRRIVAEDEYNSFIGKAYIHASTSACYLIIDESVQQKTQVKRFGDPLIISSDINEIAETLGVDSDVLNSTLSFYNDSVALGIDRDFGKEAKHLVDLGGKTLYAYRTGTESCYTASLGGLKVDAEARVLDHADKVIEGLYAAGRNAGTWFGWYPGSGSCMLDALVFGRIAGKSAAAANA